MNTFIQMIHTYEVYIYIYIYRHTRYKTVSAPPSAVERRGNNLRGSQGQSCALL